MDPSCEYDELVDCAIFGKQKETLKTQELIKKEQWELKSLDVMLPDLQTNPPRFQIPYRIRTNMPNLTIYTYLPIDVTSFFFLNFLYPFSSKSLGQLGYLVATIYDWDGSGHASSAALQTRLPTTNAETYAGHLV